MRLAAGLNSVPIRLRLTLGFGAVMAVVLAVIGTFVYFHFKAGLDAGLDRALSNRASDVSTLVTQTANRPVSRVRLPLEHGEDVVQLLDFRGRVLDSSDRSMASVLVPSETREAMRRAVTVQRGEKRRLYARPLTTSGRRMIVVVGASLAQRERAMETLGGALLIGGPLILLVALAAGYALAAGALRPVESMRRRALTISAEEPEARMPLGSADDEVRRLGETLNQMLDRLEVALRHERQFVADASHELRTPLAILRLELELALRNERPQSALREAVASAINQTDRLAQLAEDLLVLARSDEGQLPVRSQSVVAGDILAATARHFAARAEGRSITIAGDPELTFAADELRLGQALGNLLDNALRYGSGAVTLSARRRDGHVELHVANVGPGFPAEFLSRAFERFSRGDVARSPGGAGLGLSIVDAIARAHGGRARAANRDDGPDVWLSLPL